MNEEQNVLWIVLGLMGTVGVLMAFTNVQIMMMQVYFVQVLRNDD